MVLAEKYAQLRMLFLMSLRRARNIKKHPALGTAAAIPRLLLRVAPGCAVRRRAYDAQDDAQDFLRVLGTGFFK